MVDSICRYLRVGKNCASEGQFVMNFHHVFVVCILDFAVTLIARPESTHRAVSVEASLLPSPCRCGFSCQLGFSVPPSRFLGNCRTARFLSLSLGRSVPFVVVILGYALVLTARPEICAETISLYVATSEYRRFEWRHCFPSPVSSS